MAEREKDKLHSLKFLFSFWLIGGVVGVTIACCFAGGYAESYNIMQMWIYDSVKGMQQNQTAYFMMNFKSHGKELLILLCMSFTFFSMLYKSLFCFWKGIMIGFIYAASIKSYSMNGLLLGIAYMFPQGIFYGGAIVAMFSLSRRIEEKQLYSFGKKTALFWNVLPILIVAFLCIGIGAFLEGNINLFLLKKILAKCIS